MSDPYDPVRHARSLLREWAAVEGNPQLYADCYPGEIERLVRNLADEIERLRGERESLVQMGKTEELEDVLGWLSRRTCPSGSVCGCASLAETVKDLEAGEHTIYDEESDDAYWERRKTRNA